ncbi:MAG: putative toxin-antitoxin system toxin component, PIN family [Pseudomonadota bacterium]
MMPLRLVLDTNVWLDWLVFNDPGIAAISRAVEAEDAKIFATVACEQELMRVLTYPMRKVALDADTQAACLAQFRRMARPLENASCGDSAELPRCADADDQKFLELARDCRADFLITRDRDLLVFARRKYQPLPFHIVTPPQFASARAGAPAAA